MQSKEKVRKVLTSHNLMYLSTVDEKGFPKCRSVDFAIGEDESVLYFMTHKMTNKVQQIRQNNNVFVVVDHDCPSMEELQQLVYIRSTGKAYIMDTPEEAQKAFGLIMQKFPYLKDLPGDPGDFLVIKVELAQVTVSDNTVRFGYTEEVSYR